MNTRYQEEQLEFLRSEAEEAKAMARAKEIVRRECLRLGAVRARVSWALDEMGWEVEGQFEWTDGRAYVFAWPEETYEGSWPEDVCLREELEELRGSGPWPSAPVVIGAW